MNLVYFIATILIASVYAEIKLDSASGSLNKFALKFLADISSRTSSDTNLAISPYTIWIAMSVLNEGAKGNTAKQLETTLGIPPIGALREEFRRSQQDIVHKIAQKQNGVTLEILNSLFTSAEATLNEQFKQLVRILYTVEVEALDFGDVAGTTRYINEKLSKATHGRLPEAINEDAVRYAKMFITSALFFKGTWDLKFDKDSTRNQPFYNENREEIGKVRMMHNSGNFPYSRILNDRALAVELPYVGGRMSMIAILPTGRATLSSTLQTLSETPIGKIIGDLERARQLFNESEVKVYLPKFKISSGLQLQTELQKLGIRDAFDQSVANLTGISSANNLFVSRVLHKAEIEVDEEGTEGAAVTVIEITDRFISPSFTANRPFAFFVVDKLTHTIIFMGTVCNPKTD